MQKNVAGQKWIVFAFDVTTNLPKTGDAANITANIRLNAGTADAVDDTNPTELEDGYYAFDIDQAECDADLLSLHPESATADIQVIATPATIYTRPPNFSAMGIETDGDLTKVNLCDSNTDMRGTDNAALNSTVAKEATVNALNNIDLSTIEGSSVLAKEATLTSIKGGGFTNETLEELMVAIKTRLASRTYAVVGAAPTSVTVTDGTILEGDYTTMATIDQTYLKIQETGNFQIDTTYTGVDQVYDKFTFAGKYIGSAGHKVDLYMYNYNTTNWDDVLVTFRDIPNTSEDIIIEFDVPGTSSDYFDGVGPYTAQIRIEHELTFLSSHAIWIDALCFGEVERIYVPADNITIQDTNLEITNDTYGLSALKDIFDEIKGAGWTAETLKSIQDAVDSIDTELDTLAIEASLTEIKGAGFDTDQHSLTDIKNTIG